MKTKKNVLTGRLENLGRPTSQPVGMKIYVDRTNQLVGMIIQVNWTSWPVGMKTNVDQIGELIGLKNSSWLDKSTN